MHCHIARLPPPPARGRRPTYRAPSLDIVMKLLAKSPDDRYQGAYGLRMDLAECLAQLEAASAIEPFPLGRHDYVRRAPDSRRRLYGREAELARPRRRVAARQPGRERAAPGVRLRRHRQVGPRRTRSQKSVAQGKGLLRRRQVRPDQPDRPLRGRGARLPGARPSPLDRARGGARAVEERIASAVGQNGQLLIDLIPELELLLGPQPARPAARPDRGAGPLPPRVPEVLRRHPRPGAPARRLPR